MFEGPEKTLSLCFKSRKIATRSLRLIPRACWEEVLKHAKCEILSVVESCPAILAPKLKEKVVVTKGLTAYLLSESSLFVSDTTLTLKTCGRTTPLAALEPLMDLVVPTWRDKAPEDLLKYATFTRLGYMRPEDQLEPHTSWAQEVAYLNKHFTGEAVILGSEATSAQHVYVANYLPKDEIADFLFTQVALTDLDTAESLRRYADGDGFSAPDKAPLQTAWSHLHGDEKRSVAANAHLDERFFEPIGYSSNGVFGRHFTTVHATPQPGCSYISVETSMPMTKEARQRFVGGAQSMCKSDTMVVTEFALCAKLFSGGAPPEVQGFQVQRTSQTAGETFACAHHHYKRVKDHTFSPWSRVMPLPVPTTLASKVHNEVTEAPQGEKAGNAGLRTFEVGTLEQAPVNAAEHFLKCPGDIQTDAPVALLDTASLRRQADIWHQQLPRVEPFYAVKCNPHPAVLEALWSVWKERGAGGFDCASPSEIDLVRALGVDTAEDIIFANPCKQATAVEFARSVGVRRLVFDNVSELEKLATLYPDAELVIRVQTDDSLAQCPLSNKFGAAPADCGELLTRAHALGLKVVGVSFHVGSGCSQLGAFRGALQRARDVFDEAERQGFRMSLLDIGGGFPGWDEDGQATFADHAADIRDVLEELFPSPALRVIAEPGRFFAAKAQAMLTTVVAVAEASRGNRYYLNDGLYGSFNCLLYDHAVAPRPTILRGGRELTEASFVVPEGPCTIFGPTCDGFDVITDSMSMPRLEVGDRLLFPHMGAYTSAASTSFNGFAPASCFVYQSQLKAGKAPVNV